MQKVRELYYYKSYFVDFYNKQTEKVKEKIDLGLYYLQYFHHVPGKFVGSTQYSNLFYLRIKQRTDIYRIFFCYDEGPIVVLFNGFQKKTDKIPNNEIRKALKIQIEYHEEKEK